MGPEAGKFEVIEFGPTRGVGVAMQAVGGGGDFAGLWTQRLLPRGGEIARPEGGVAFGVCRCVPGATDGTFEYVALLEATAEAAVPAGMIAIDIPRGHYMVFAVTSYAELGAAWRKVPDALAAHPEWQPYCGPDGCECATHPSFEYYPWDPEHTGRAYIYVPVRKA
jgi:predicted transcriptional regulator YdeE